MFNKLSISDLLYKTRAKTRNAQESLIIETKRLLQKDLLSDKNVLQNLKTYEKSFALVDEEDIDILQVFTYDELKSLAIKSRLRLINGKNFKQEIPYEAELKIEHHNLTYQKKIEEYYILESARINSDKCYALLLKTGYNNFYLLHTWGNNLSYWHRLAYWPLRGVEYMSVTLITFSLLIAMLVPGWLIVRDIEAPFWNGYRLALILHLLILFACFTTFFMLAFSIKFSNNWNKAG